MNHAAQSVGEPESYIVEQNDDDIGCVRGQPVGLLTPDHFGFLQRLAGDTCRRRRREGQNGAVPGLGFGTGSPPRTATAEQRRNYQAANRENTDVTHALFGRTLLLPKDAGSDSMLYFFALRETRPIRGPHS
jgi:hypothetical protein